MDWPRIGSSAYWVTFTVTFLLVAMWESRHPERDWRIPAGKRWTVHGVLILLSSLFRAGVLRLTPVAAAIAAQESSWSAARVSDLPLWAGVPFTVLLLDLTKYVTHRLFHAIPWLWRVHRVHHSDPDFDVSTGLRFHPLEPLLPQAADLAMIFALALPVEGVVAAQVLAGAINFIEHANAKLPSAWELRLRRWVVTPQLHRIHHSQELPDQGSNFGELFPWWDRWAGTYRAEPVGGELVVGLPGYQDERSMGLTEMLTQPFQGSRTTPTQER